MKAILLFTLFSFALCFDFSIFELASTNHLLSDSLRSFAGSLNHTLNLFSNNTIKHAEDTSFTFILQTLNTFQMTYEGYGNVVREKNALVYEIPKVVYFEVEAVYFINYGLLPITGRCVFAVDIKSTKYRQTYSGKEISPSIDANFNITVASVTNNIFNAREQIVSLIPHVKNYFALICQKVFTASIKDYYERKYGDSNHYVSFPRLGGYTVRLKNKLKGFSLGENSYGSVVMVDYSQDVAKTSLDSIPDRNFTRCIQFQIDELIAIIKKELAVVKNLKLTEDMIPPHSYFHLNLIALSEIYPDLFYEPHNTTGVITFSCIPELIGYYLEDKKVFGFALPSLSLKITLANKERTQLVDVDSSVVGEFAPVFAEAEDGTRRVYLKLEGKSVKVTVRAVSNLWSNKYAILNLRGLKGFVDNMVSQYFMRFHKQKLLGTGLLVSVGVPLGDFDYIDNAGGSRMKICFK
eukprot:TRINITY_DN615_c0_g2_i20.p1 TRINITY_DN615_c0_g2~~TRINITY_DN615_c0_g2_i20.p1  ORF type:complete len:465 (+),score=95.14 TRINITY_DN615_c0_g2_i20:126-1520(+)